MTGLVLASVLTATGAQTADEVRAAPTIKAEICSSLDQAVVVQRLVTAWARCYGGSSRGSQAVMVGTVPILIPTRASSIAVRVEGNADRTTVILEGTTPIGIMLLADVQRTDTCQASVQVMNPSSSNERGRELGRLLVENSVKYVEEPDAACPRDKKR